MKSQDISAGSPFDRRAIPAGAVESCWDCEDGHVLRRIDWSAPPGAPRGSLMFLPGRADCYEKYLETLDHWHRRGWHMTATDWRGQAFSGRLGADSTTGHIDDFAVWIDDLAAFWWQWRAASPAPHVLVGHSMGGHLALRALAERRIDPDAAVLSAPMLGLHPAFLPLWLQRRLVGAVASLGDPRRPVWRGSERPGRGPGDRLDLLTHDRVRYEDEDWWRKARPELAMGAPSWGWIEQALGSIAYLRRPGLLEAVKVPVLVLGTKADRLVDFRAIEQASRRIPDARLIAFGPEARHEILREEDAVRNKALAAIDGFLDSVAPVKA